MDEVLCPALNRMLLIYTSARSSMLSSATGTSWSRAAAQITSALRSSGGGLVTRSAAIGMARTLKGRPFLRSSALFPEQECEPEKCHSERKSFLRCFTYTFVSLFSMLQQCCPLRKLNRPCTSLPTGRGDKMSLYPRHPMVHSSQHQEVSDVKAQVRLSCDIL